MVHKGLPFGPSQKLLRIEKEAVSRYVLWKEHHSTNNNYVYQDLPLNSTGDIYGSGGALLAAGSRQSQFSRA